jgi:hypothetical protein
MSMKKTAIVLILCIFWKWEFAQNTNEYPAEVLARIKQVENNLVPWAMAQDSQKFSLNGSIQNKRIKYCRY